MRVQISRRLTAVTLLTCLLLHLPIRAQVVCPSGSFRDSIRAIRAIVEKEGRTANAALRDPSIVYRIWMDVCSLVEMVRKGDPPEVLAVVNLFDQPEPLTPEQRKEIDGLIAATNGQGITTSKTALMQLSGVLEELVGFEDRRVMRFIGPLLAENVRIAPEFNSPKPSVQLHALDAAAALSSKGILPEETRKLQTPEQWQAWWAKHKKEYGPVLKLPSERKTAAAKK